MRNLRGDARRVRSQKNYLISSYFNELRRIPLLREIGCDSPHEHVLSAQIRAIT